MLLGPPAHVTSNPNGFLLLGAAAVDDMADDGGRGGGFFTLPFRFNDMFESIESAGLVGFDGFDLFLPFAVPPLPPLLNFIPGMFMLEWADIMCCESVNKHIPRSISVAGVVVFVIVVDVFLGSGTNGRETRFRCDLLMKLLLTGTIVWAFG